MTPRRKFSLLALLTAFAAAALFALYQGQSAPQRLPPPAPPITTIPSFTAGTFTDRDLAAGTLLVSFFASWCVPCEAEHPVLMDLAKTVPIYGIASLDTKHDAAAFLERLGDPYKKLGLDDEGLVAKLWGVRGIPTTFLLRDGIVVYRHEQPLTPHAVRNEILPLLGAQN